MGLIITPPCIADGPTLTAAEPASCVPLRCPLTLPRAYWTEGKRWRLRMAGKLSSSYLNAGRTLNASPGYARFDLRLGGIVVWDTGEIALNSSGDFDDVPWTLDAELVCRSIGTGTSATLLGTGTVTCAALDGASTSPPAANGVIVVPVNTAPAVGAGFDSYVALSVDVFSTAGVKTGSRTVQQYSIEEL